MGKIIIHFILLIAPILINAQALILNGGFEELNICKEFKAKCAPEAWFRIPSTDVSIKVKGVKRVFEGGQSEVIIVGNKNNPLRYRVFLYTMLLCPLEENIEYSISFYLNPLYEKEYQLDILFRQTELISGIDNPIDHTPQISINKQNKTWGDKKSNWQKIEVSYIAKGGEQFIFFGNFNKKQYPFTKKTVFSNTLGDIAYLLDKVEIAPKNKEKSSICDEYEENKTLLYNTNHRHLDKEGIILPPEKSNPETTDSIQQDSSVKERPPLSQNSISKKATFEISDIAFDFNSHTLKDSFLPLLDSILIQIISLNPTKIRIQGHSDNIGNKDYNLNLSKMRAISVQKYIRSKVNQNKYTIIAEGLGETKPKIDNLTKENRAQNRRVEIILAD
jgi:outer membrane protein OmpA-like peptidoglycan-associated protein